MTPGHDEQGPPLLSGAEYQRLHRLEPEEFAHVPEPVKEMYYQTHEWHVQQRMGIRNAPSMTAARRSCEETLGLWRKAKRQKRQVR